MSMHPAITAALADQHRQDLTAQASAYRLARAARDSRPTRPGQPPQPRRLTAPLKVIRRAATTTAAAVAAAVVMITPAGATTQHVFAHPVAAHVFSVHSWSHSRNAQLGGRWA
jgi:hypothetical protein